jgi:hypothetical protein
MGFNPSNYTPKNAQGERDEKPVPAGIYLVGITWMEKKSDLLTKLGAKIIDGPLEGRMFFPPFFTDTSKAFNADQAYYFAKASGLDEVEWHFTEEWFRENVMGKALKVRVEVKKDGQYTNRNIRQAFDRDLLSSEERKLLITWEDDFAQGRSSESSDGDFADDEDFADGRDDDEGDGQRNGDFPDDNFGNDDIPF